MTSGGPNPVITGLLDRVAEGGDLSRAEAERLLAEMMSGRADPVQIAGVLVALRAKGETVEEIVGLATAMRALAAHVTVGGPLLDTAGTGGGLSTFNVSTAAALVAASVDGVRVAKHGNRSATSRSGSADVLEAVGGRIDLDPAGVAACIDETGFGFLFAPRHHAATRWVVGVRRALAVRTIFNVLGPLTNPAGATHQLVGVADPLAAPKLAEALRRLGCHHGLVVTGADGMDELTTTGLSTVYEVRPAGVTSMHVSPGMFGLGEATAADLAGGEPADNAAILHAVLSGEAGPHRDLVLLNAGAAVYAAGAAELIADGIEAARAAIDTGAAARTLDAWVEATHRHAAPAIDAPAAPVDPVVDPAPTAAP